MGEYQTGIYRVRYRMSGSICDGCKLFYYEKNNTKSPKEIGRQKISTIEESYLFGSDAEFLGVELVRAFRQDQVTLENSNMDI